MDVFLISSGPSPPSELAFFFGPLAAQAARPPKNIRKKKTRGKVRIFRTLYSRSSYEAPHPGSGSSFCRAPVQL